MVYPKSRLISFPQRFTLRTLTVVARFTSLPSRPPPSPRQRDRQEEPEEEQLPSAQPVAVAPASGHLRPSSNGLRRPVIWRRACLRQCHRVAHRGARMPRIGRHQVQNRTPLIPTRHQHTPTPSRCQPPRACRDSGIVGRPAMSRIGWSCTTSSMLPTVLHVLHPLHLLLYRSPQWLYWGDPRCGDGIRFTPPTPRLGRRAVSGTSSLDCSTMLTSSSAKTALWRAANVHRWALSFGTFHP